MDHRLIQPASRDQIVAIIRQRAERANRDIPAHLGQALFPAPAFVDFPGRERVGRDLDRDRVVRDIDRERLGRDLDRPMMYRQAAIPPEEEHKPRTERVNVAGSVVTYRGEKGLPGIYISGQPLAPDRAYFEVELSVAGAGGQGGGPIVGLCSHRYPLDLLPGWTAESVGYHTAEGKLYKGRPRGQPFGPRCQVGDRVGCGIKFDAISKNAGLHASMVPVFFTKNGKEIGTQLVPSPPGGLFPAVGLQREGEEVKVAMEVRWAAEEDIAMSVDCGEEEWSRLHDIRLNGQLLEYVGRGKSLIDVGLAQAKTPLCTRSHYFEIEIIDPGSSCYIAIGLARKDYPRNRHPGWNKGSIAYHADDGKVFMGSGVGDPFGPRCNKGDTMGCGVMFPRDYECKSDSEEEQEVPAVPVKVREAEFNSLEEYETDSGDEEEWWGEQEVNTHHGEKVQVYFTRNGKVIGKKEVVLPKGGFFPTVGMMSCQEKVRVELKPLSG